MADLFWNRHYAPVSGLASVDSGQGVIVVANSRGGGCLLMVAALVVVGGIGSIFNDDRDDSGAGSSSVGEPDLEPDRTPESGDRERRHRDNTGSEPAPKPAPKPNPAPEPPPKPELYLVTRVIDGDTIEVANGESVRIVGIDTPEEGDCGYVEARANMERLVLGERVRLRLSDEDTDRYGRLLRYVNVGRLDAGLRQIKSGMAIARYDSRDGYGRHPREDRYIAADRTAKNFRCRELEPAPAPDPGPAGGCAPGYSPCVPVYPPDVDCGDVDGPTSVSGSDPHGLDGDGDGVACES